MTPTTNMDAATRNLLNLKDEHADRPAKQFGNIPNLRLICVELPCLETTHFQVYKYAIYFVQPCKAHYVIMVFILWS